jgi:hypothetical protein
VLTLRVRMLHRRLYLGIRAGIAWQKY